jgi:hypothetical protein
MFIFVDFFVFIFRYDGTRVAINVKELYKSSAIGL